MKITKPLFIALLIAFGGTGTAYAIWPYFVPAAIGIVAGALLLLAGDVPVGSINPTPLTQEEYEEQTPPDPIVAHEGTITSMDGVLGQVTPALLGDTLTCQGIYERTAQHFNSTSCSEGEPKGYNARGYWADGKCYIYYYTASDASGCGGGRSESAWMSGVVETADCGGNSTYNSLTQLCEINQSEPNQSAGILVSPTGQYFVDGTDGDDLPDLWNIDVDGYLWAEELMNDGSSVRTEIATNATAGQTEIIATQTGVQVIHSDGSTTTADIVDTATLDENMNILSITHDYNAADSLPETVTDTMLNKRNQESADNGAGEIGTLLDIESNTRTSNNLLTDISGQLGNLVDSSSMSDPIASDTYESSEYDTGAQSLIDGIGITTVVDSVGYDFLIPSSSACESIDYSWRGTAYSFPTNGQCTKLGTGKEMLGWFLYIITAWGIMGIATRRPV